MSKKRKVIDLSKIEDFTREDLIDLYEGNTCKKSGLEAVSEEDVSKGHSLALRCIFQVVRSGWYEEEYYAGMYYGDSSKYDTELKQVFPEEKCIIIYK